MARRLLFDLEGNGLLPELTKIHCIAAVDIDTRQRLDWKPDEIPQALETLASADKLYAHYGLGYDYPALAQVRDFKVPEAKQGDTHVLSRLIFPNLRMTDGKLVEQKRLPGAMHGKHSIAAWGHRLGIFKLHADNEDWSVWTPEIHERCIGDVATALRLWDHMQPDAYSQPAIELEHRVTRLCAVMQGSGWPFDEKAGGELHTALTVKHAKLMGELVAEFGYWFEPKEKKTKDATGCVPYFTPKRDDKVRGYVTGVPCTKIEKVTFNPGSRDHIIRCLSRLGWKPEAFTDNGKPRLDDEILEGLSERFPQGGGLVEYLLLDKRIGQLATGDKAWLKHVGSDGMMHGSINPMGTVHSRAAHFSPNLGQVPANKSPYGRECRTLFTVKPGFVMVGADMAGLQLRNLGHYLAPFDDGAYGNIVTSGDPHWATALALGMVQGDRDPDSKRHDTIREAGSKRFMYAYVFGGQGEMLGSIIRDCCVLLRTANPEWADLYNGYFGAGQSNREVGTSAKTSFDTKLNLAALQHKLAWLLKYGGKRGSLPGLDGRWVPCASDRLALNYLLSSAEAILCKRWICDAYDGLIAKGFKYGWDGDFVFLGWIHDELQAAARAGLQDEIGNIIVECARAAGEPYGYRVPLNSSYKTGSNWSETH